MKVYLGHWLGEQKRTLDRRGTKHRLISFEDVRTAKGQAARQAAKEYGFLTTPKSAAYREGYDRINWTR